LSVGAGPRATLLAGLHRPGASSARPRGVQLPQRSQLLARLSRRAAELSRRRTRLALVLRPGHDLDSSIELGHRNGAVAMRRRGLLVFALAGGLAGCGGSSAPKQAPAPAAQTNSSDLVLRPDLMGLRMLTVQQKQIPNYLEVPGRIQAAPTKVVRVFPPVGGRLLSMEVRPGDRVKK